MQGIQKPISTDLLQPSDGLDVWSLPVRANAGTSTAGCQDNGPLDVAPTAAWGVAHQLQIAGGKHTTHLCGLHVLPKCGGPNPHVDG